MDLDRDVVGIQVRCERNLVAVGEGHVQEVGEVAEERLERGALIACGAAARVALVGDVAGRSLGRCLKFLDFRLGGHLGAVPSSPNVPGHGDPLPDKAVRLGNGFGAPRSTAGTNGVSGEMADLGRRAPRPHPERPSGCDQVYSI